MNLAEVILLNEFFLVLCYRELGTVRIEEIEEQTEEAAQKGRTRATTGRSSSRETRTA